MLLLTLGSIRFHDSLASCTLLLQHDAPPTSASSLRSSPSTSRAGTPEAAETTTAP
jgi:hypothetical protein